MPPRHRHARAGRARAAGHHALAHGGARRRPRGRARPRLRPGRGGRGARRRPRRGGAGGLARGARRPPTRRRCHEPPCGGRRVELGAARRAHARVRRRPRVGRGAHERRPDGAAHGRPDRRRARRRPAPRAARRAQRRPAQRGGLPQVGQGPDRYRRGGGPPRRPAGRRPPVRRHPPPRAALPPRPASRHRPGRDPPARVRRRHRRVARPLRGGAVRPLRRTGGVRRRPAGRRAGRHRAAGVRRLFPRGGSGGRHGEADGHPGRGTRVGGGQPGQLLPRHLGGRPGALRPHHGAVPVAAAASASRRGHRRGVGAPPRGVRPGVRRLRRRQGGGGRDDRDLPGPARDPRRGSGDEPAARRRGRAREGVPAHPRPRRAARPARVARTAAAQVRRYPAGDAVHAGGVARRVTAAPGAAPVWRDPLRRDARRPDAPRGVLRWLCDEPVRQGRCGGPRPAQARHPRHPHAERHGARHRRGRAGHGRARRRRRARAVRGRRRVRHDRPRRDHRLLPDRVARPARARRQVRAARVQRPCHRHLAVPAGAGEVRHGGAVPARPERLERGLLPAPRPGAGARRDPGRRGVPRAGDQDRRRHDRLFTRLRRRSAPGARLPTGAGRRAPLVLPCRPQARLRRGAHRARVGGARLVRVVRVLQGARGRVRPAHLPVGVAEVVPPGRVPRRSAHPRSGHVPEAADPRGGTARRCPDPAARRQRVRRGLSHRACRGGRSPARRPVGVRRRQRHHGRRDRTHLGGPAVHGAGRLLAAGSPELRCGRAPRPRRGVRLPVRHRRPAGCGCPGGGDPARSAPHPRRPRSRRSRGCPRPRPGARSG